MCNIILLQNFQPHEHSGKIQGIFIGAQGLAGALGSLLVGYLWDLELKSFWFVICGYNALAIHWLIVMMFVNYCKEGDFIRKST